MKIEAKFLPWIIIGILVIILLLPKACGDKDKEETKITYKDTIVKTPEVKGEFDKPTNSFENPLSEPDTVYIAGQKIYLTSPINDQLKNDLLKAKDSIERYRLLVTAAQKREYSQDFNDDSVEINVKSTVFGTLDNTEVKYKVKPQEIKLQTKTIEKTVYKTDNFSFVGGMGYAKDINSHKDVIEANAGIRLGKVIILGSGNTKSEIGGKVLIEF